MLYNEWDGVKAIAKAMEMCVLEYNRARSTISLQGGESDWACDLFLQGWEADARFDTADYLWEQAVDQRVDITYDEILLFALS